MKSLPGVYITTKKDGSVYYRSSITFKNKHISLGSYNTQELAHQAYLDACTVIDSKHPYTPDDFSSNICSVLKYRKWITLINFKNNGIYIKTPIYLRSNFFNYYLSKNDVLIFDVDDLFYYSNHSIMRRGSHLFVAEYGMQTNIASRYGIRNFARPDIDFRFVNGDIRDFRYANIEVLNPFQGVTIEFNNGSPTYITRIHINGNYMVGRYDTLEHAAIAYNKAVDTLQQNGSTKNYEKNFLKDLTREEYAKLYDRIHISPKLNNSQADSL